MARPLRRQRVEMRSSLYAARVFSVFESSSRSRRPLVDGHVLEHRPERARRRVDLRLGLRREPDHLRVAAALEVEDAGRRPSRARRRRSAARSGSAESVVLPVPESPKKIATSPSSPTFAEQCIGNTPSSGSRSFITREDRLLDLARVEGAADQHLLAGGCSTIERAGARAVLLGVGLEAGRVQHDRLRLKPPSSSRVRSMNIVRANSAWYACARDDAHADAVRRIGARERVDDVQPSALAEVRGHLLAQPVEAAPRRAAG